MKSVAIKCMIFLLFSLVYINEASDFEEEIEFEFEEKVQDKCAVIDSYLPRKTRNSYVASCTQQGKSKGVCMLDNKKLSVADIKAQLKKLCKAGKFKP